MAKRPWGDFAKIDRIELNSGDVKFRPYIGSIFKVDHKGLRTKAEAFEQFGEFESLDAAEAALNAWWAEFWPVQVKSRRPA